MTLLRQGLLQGRRVSLSGSVSADVREALLALGAEVEGDADELYALVHDVGAALASDDVGAALASDGLSTALEHTWAAIAGSVAEKMIEGRRGGKIVLIAPRPGSGPHAQAARDALENLARTLSVEWARYGITTTAIAPGGSTTEQEIATLVCFLLSRAGDYFSGCRFELGAV